jgi:hypothetical protein
MSAISGGHISGPPVLLLAVALTESPEALDAATLAPPVPVAVVLAPPMPVDAAVLPPAPLDVAALAPPAPIAVVTPVLVVFPFPEPAFAGEPEDSSFPPFPPPPPTDEPFRPLAAHANKGRATEAAKTLKGTSASCRIAKPPREEWLD